MKKITYSHLEKAIFGRKINRETKYMRPSLREQGESPPANTHYTQKQNPS
jgi:hypothetical protein